MTVGRAGQCSGKYLPWVRLSKPSLCTARIGIYLGSGSETLPMHLKLPLQPLPLTSPHIIWFFYPASSHLVQLPDSAGQPLERGGEGEGEEKRRGGKGRGSLSLGSLPLTPWLLGTVPAP